MVVRYEKLPAMFLAIRQVSARCMVARAMASVISCGAAAPVPAPLEAAARWAATALASSASACLALPCLALPCLVSLQWSTVRTRTLGLAWAGKRRVDAVVVWREGGSRSKPNRPNQTICRCQRKLRKNQKPLEKSRRLHATRRPFVFVASFAKDDGRGDARVRLGYTHPPT